MDDAAPSQQWVHPDGTTAGPGEGVPDAVSDETADRARQGYNAAQTARSEGIEVAADRHLPEEHRQTANEALGSGQQLQDDVANAPEEEQGEVAKRGLKDRVFGIKDKIPQEHRDKAGEKYDQGVQFLKDEFPEERRDQVRFAFALTSRSRRLFSF